MDKVFQNYKKCTIICIGKAGQDSKECGSVYGQMITLMGTTGLDYNKCMIALIGKAGQDYMECGSVYGKMITLTGEAGQGFLFCFSISFPVGEAGHLRLSTKPVTSAKCYRAFMLVSIILKSVLWNVAC